MYDAMATKVDELREMLGSELDDIEFKVSTNYTLADAIRDGSKVTEHCNGGWGNVSVNACALTAAMIAVRAKGCRIE